MEKFVYKIHIYYSNFALWFFIKTNSTTKQNFKLYKSEISKINALKEQYLNILWSDISGRKNLKIYYLKITIYY